MNANSKVTLVRGYMRAIRSPSEYVTITYAGVGASLLGSVFVVRALGASGRGVLAFVVVSASYLTLVTGLGVPLSVRLSAARSGSDLPGLMGVVKRSGLVATLLCAAVALPLAFFLGQDLRGTGQFAVFLVMLSCGLAVVGIGNTQILAASGSQRELAISRTIPSVAVAATTGILAVLGLLPLALAIALLAVRPVLEVIISKRWLPQPRRGSAMGPHIRSGIGLLPLQLAESSVGRLDQLMLLPLVGAAELGVYAVVVSIVTLPFAFTQASINKWFGSSVRETDATMASLLRKLLSTIAITAVPLLPVVVLAPLLLPVVFGNDFEGQMTLVMVLGLSTLLLSGCFAGNYLLLAIGSTRMTVLPWAMGTAATVISLPIVAPRFGIVGAAWVSVASYAIVLGGFVALLRIVVPRHRKVSRDPC